MGSFHGFSIATSLSTGKVGIAIVVAQFTMTGFVGALPRMASLSTFLSRLLYSCLTSNQEKLQDRRMGEGSFCLKQLRVIYRYGD
jgi:hypothetical protein